MILERFEATDFRNIASCSLNLSPGVNLFFGENAQGKTNVLEGIYLFARGRSFRTTDEKELLRFPGKDAREGNFDGLSEDPSRKYEKAGRDLTAADAPAGFRLSITYRDRQKENKLEYAAFGREHRRLHNGVRLAKTSEMIGNFRAVLFTPDDLTIVKGSPEERRNFLNIAIAQFDPSYVSIYARYKVLLDNRNALLKAAKSGKYFDRSELAAFSEAMAEECTKIREARMRYVAALSEEAPKVQSDLSDGKEILSLSYLSDIPEEITEREAVKAAYLSVFTDRVEREIAAGTSLFGVQRDDLGITIGGKSARDFASQGQQRSVVLALKIAEGEILRRETSEYPVYLFDDVLSELDDRRRSFLLSAAKDRQMIMTSCEFREDLLSLFEHLKVFRVKDGGYEEIS